MLTIKTSKREEMIDVTNLVQEKISIKNGLVNVYVSHATAAIIIQENDDPNVCEDILDFLRKLIPNGKWKHDIIDNNADSHIKAAMLGPSETIPVKDGKLQLGRWQALMLVELDGPRERKIIITESHIP